jgi:hypothetical protein
MANLTGHDLWRNLMMVNRGVQVRMYTIHDGGSRLSFYGTVDRQIKIRIQEGYSSAPHRDHALSCRETKP